MSHSVPILKQLLLVGRLLHPKVAKAAGPIVVFVVVVRTVWGYQVLSQTPTQ